jgi:hypothetical protein
MVQFYLPAWCLRKNFSFLKRFKQLLAGKWRGLSFVWVNIYSYNEVREPFRKFKDMLMLRVGRSAFKHASPDISCRAIVFPGVFVRGRCYGSVLAVLPWLYL